MVTNSKWVVETIYKAYMILGATSREAERDILKHVKLRGRIVFYLLCWWGEPRCNALTLVYNEWKRK